MAELKSMLDEILEAWRDVREGIVDELNNIPRRRADFRPTPHVRTVREQVQHILEVAMMAAGNSRVPIQPATRAVAEAARDVCQARWKARRRPSSSRCCARR